MSRADKIKYLIDIRIKYKKSQSIQHISKKQKIDDVEYDADDDYEIDDCDYDNIDCMICDESYNLEKIFIVPKCSHKICRDCLKAYCCLKVAENICDIHCPVYPNCNVMIEHDDFVDIVQEYHIIKKFDDLLQRQWLSKSGLVVFCPKCDEANEKLIGQKYVCHFCKYEFCGICNKEYHGDIPCNEIELWKNDEEKAVVIMLHREGYRLCPNKKCNYPMKRIEGCDQVRCSKCKVQFNWKSLPGIDENGKPTGDYVPGDTDSDDWDGDSDYWHLDSQNSNNNNSDDDSNDDSD